MEASVKKTILISIVSALGFLLLLALGYLMYFYTQFSVYHDYQYKFSIKYPKTWAVMAHPKKGVAVIFMRPKDTALDTLQENFNVTIQPVPDELLNLAAFSETVKKQMSTVFGKSINIVVDEPRHWGWREGHEIAIEAPSPDHLKMVNAWVLRSNQAYILTFLGDMNKYMQDFFVVNEMIRSLKLL